MSSNWLPYLYLKYASAYHKLRFLKLNISRLLPPIIVILLFLLCGQFCLTLWPHGLLPISPLCQSDFPSKNTGMDCHFLLQGIVLTQRSNPGLLCLLHCRWLLYHWVTRKDPIILLDAFNSAFLSHFDILISFMLSHYSASIAKPKFFCPSNKRGLYWITRVGKPSVFWLYSTFNFPFLHTSSIFLLMSG